jgi:beta-glucosidase
MRGLRVRFGGGVVVLATICGAGLAALAGSAAASVEPNAQDGLAAAQRRAQGLVAQMTLDEKIGMVHGSGFITGNGYTGFTPGIPRLGIPPFYLADGPNGVGNGAHGVTAFPAAINGAATWDTPLMKRYGAVLGGEHAGKGNDVALAPTMNILRVPGWGRAFESYSEDPELAGDIGAAEIQGIQSQGVIADAKHYAANNQETDRDTVSAAVGEKALREIYTRQFEKAVKAGGALSTMCAYNRVNGGYACENSHLLSDILKGDWGFRGFVVSDWWATHSTAPAANAGLDLEMPGGNGPIGGPERLGQALKDAVQAGQVPVSRLDDMVRRILTARIATGQLDRTSTGSHDAVVTSAAHQQFARDLSAQGTVLLKNDRWALPLDGVHSLAVIGADAQDAAIYTGGGSANVIPSATTTPLDGIRARAGSNVQVSYAKGTSGTAALPVLPSNLLTPSSGAGNGLSATYYASPDFSGAPVISRVDPTVSFSAPAGLSGVWSARWTGTFTPATSGAHRFSLTNSGTARLYIDGKLVATNYSQFGGAVAHAVLQLTAGAPVSIRVEYVANTGFGLPARLQLGWQAPAPALVQQAVDAARAADAAVVFVNDVRTEGSDLSSLALPGDQDALIDAVTAVNPRTIVVLNTGGPALMPWVDRVAAVVEAWYPGQENGNAIAAVLFGDANPSGKLPVTFPRSDQQGPLTTPERFPGSNGTARYDEGVLVGYRWYDAKGEQPLFPFGHGLSYTSFRYDRLRVNARGGHRPTVTLRVTNTGPRAGAEIVQLYLGDPPAAGEPPRQLRGFQKVQLAPGQSANATFRLGARDLATWSETANRWATHPGTYRVMVGSSSRDIRLQGAFRIGHGHGDDD